MSSILQMNKVRQGEFNELALVPWSCVCVCVCVGGGKAGQRVGTRGSGLPCLLHARCRRRGLLRCCLPQTDVGHSQCCVLDHFL